MLLPSFLLQLEKYLATLFLVLLGCLVLADDPDLVYSAEELPAEFTSEEASLHTIVFTGDIMPWDRTKELIQRHGGQYPYNGVLPILQKADLTVGNLEGPVAVKAKITEGTFRYKIPPENLFALRDAGFDLLSLSNNHAMDCGPEGLQETLNFLQKTNMQGFGAGGNMQEAARAAVVRVGPHRIAFVAAICPETYYKELENSLEDRAYDRMLQLMDSRMGAGTNRSGLIIATTENVRRLVKAAALDTDLVIACLHFGIRYHRPPSEQQRQLAFAAIDAGASLVVGHHSHIWQPVEMYRGIPIVYGLGNFAFGSANRRANEGMLLRATLDQQGIAQLEFFPLNTKNRDPSVNYQSKIMEEDAASVACSFFNRMSLRNGAKLTYANGRSRLDLRSENSAPRQYAEKIPGKSPASP